MSSIQTPVAPTKRIQPKDIKFKSLFDPSTAYNNDGSKLILELDDFMKTLFDQYSDYNPREIMMAIQDSAMKIGISRSTHLSEMISLHNRIEKSEKERSRFADLEV